MGIKKRRDSSHNPDLLEIFHNNKPICRIIPTDPYAKVDAFSSFRPQPYTCLDYNISQTECKLDAGPTKIHIKQTEATYVPNPTPVKRRRKRIRWCSGGPPQWKFIDEKWREQQQINNAHNLKEMYRRQTRKRIIDKQLKGQSHIEMILRVGPDWYQELSPKQMNTVDNLKKCIKKDLALNTIMHVKENIAELGLVLRPNSNHLQIALNECCQCPVEFLLILYQLIDPKRKKYSINDRLLLSGVVHLAMRSTLRELHIRIPSPPPPLPVGKKSPKKEKRIKYESPYLEPYTFAREPPKFTGIYYNKHVQRPESPYFDYLINLKCEILMCKPREVLENEADEDLIEANYAQQVYEELVDYRPVRPLLLPSKYVPCYNRMNRKPEEAARSSVSSKKKNNKPESKFGAVEDRVEDIEDEQVTKELVYVDINEVEGSHGDEKSEVSGEKISNDSVGEDKAVSTGEIEEIQRVDEQEEVEKVTCGPGKLFECKKEAIKFIEKPLCRCEQCQNDRIRKEEEVLKKKQWMDAIEKRRKERQKERARQIAQEEAESGECLTLDVEEDEEDEEDEKEIKSDEQSLKKTCDCYEKYLKRVADYEEYQKRLNLVITMKKQADRFVIGGVSMTQQGPVYQLQGIEPKRDCRCAQQHKEQLAQQYQMDTMPKVPKGRTCFEVCGVRETPQGKVFILNQVVAKPQCQCMDIYEKFANKHDACLELYKDYMDRVDLMVKEHEYDLKDEQVEIDESEEDEEEEALPQVPKGRTYFEIGGVRETPQGKVFILNSVAGKTKKVCQCSKDRDMPKLPKGPTIFEIGGVRETPKGKVFIINSVVGKKQCQCGQSEEEEEEVCIKKVEEKKKKCCKSPKKPTKKIKLCQCANRKRGKARPIKRKQCCQMEIEEKHSPCAREETPPPPPPKEETPPPPPTLRRFFIYEKIRCNGPWQRNVIKKALASMAEDGYPLAKLPEAYKLPHFKLWMKMRCGKFWTQEQKLSYVLVSRHWWRHTDQCYKKIRTPKLKITLDEAQAFTWANAVTVKKMTSDAINWYFRKVRQEAVNSGREFFPTMFNYEFPFWTFRDCYFAYVPSKEEEVLARKVWQSYENNVNK